MTKEIKDCVVEAARIYMAQKGISQNELQSRSGVSYLSTMMNGVYTYKNSRSGDIGNIPDKWFQKLADYIGYKIQKDYWPTVLTSQFKTIVAELKGAKEDARIRMIIGETGCGKSYSIDRFRKSNPKGTYVITCSGQTCQSSLIRRILQALRMDCKGNCDFLLDRISAEIRNRQLAGDKPLIILDEAENLRLPTFKAVKSIYDYLKGQCGIVLIGTDQLLDKLEVLSKKNKEGMPQFYDRFSSGLRYLRPIDRTYSEFLSTITLEPGLKELVLKICRSYRSLSDYMEPALRKADEKGVMLTEDFFRIIHDLPKA
ncbi:ATP-binding protein [Parabacteroides sp. AM08-6]|uniref:ATP-binding protein n=1 Tax=Parabacteroides sp. AM08-6 TaxID=2292053 RepID=UPI000FEE506C|nr:ATP-binding protein [Parabacteroides sp. AM08-6]RHJ87606.1 hypothetical protein DW103_00025 [Parabacteroides sp. AM08-6]